jgi:hypothetical protein
VAVAVVAAAAGGGGCAANLPVARPIVQYGHSDSPVAGTIVKDSWRTTQTGSEICNVLTAVRALISRLATVVC